MIFCSMAKKSSSFSTYASATMAQNGSPVTSEIRRRGSSPRITYMISLFSTASLVLVTAQMWKSRAAKPRRRTCLGVAPIIRRNVRVKCAASEKPAAYAASATDVPRASSRAPHCKRNQSTYGRSGTPTDVVNRCRNRDGESLTLVATASNDTASASASVSGRARRTRLTR